MRILKHYQMTQHCFVGRPNPPMKYFKTGDGVSERPFPGEGAILFDPARVEAKHVNRNWKVVQVDLWILDFGSSEANPRMAVEIIQHNGFRHQCFVGRPNPSIDVFPQARISRICSWRTGLLPL